MLRDAIIIFKKETLNVFKDKGAIFSVFILPFIIMPAIFVTIGFVTERQQRTAHETVYNLNLENANDARFMEVLPMFLNFNLVDSDYEENFVKVEFPNNFIPGEKSEINVYYDSTSQKLTFAAQRVANALSAYQEILTNEKLNAFGMNLNTLNSINTNLIDIAPEESQGSQFAAMMIPYMLLIYIFSSGMGIALDTTAGEKERGSLASILVNQVSRTSIALGKLFYVMIIGIMNAASTFGGLIFAFYLNSSMIGGEMEFANFSAFTPMAILGLLISILVLSSVASSLFVFLGSFAKNMKQASGFASPVLIIAIVVGVATMNLDTTSNLLLYLIPVGNVIFVLKDIIIAQFNTIGFILMVISNLTVTSIFVFLISKLFNTEKILNTI
jgi:sodium transport system permease protein